MPRYRSIDLLRGLAIILMIQVHFVENLSSRESSSAALYDASTLLGGVPAPLFTFVSGLSYGLWLRKQESLRRRDREITAVTLRRGLFLFTVGIVFNFCVWLPEDTFNWDILTLIGTSLLWLAFARKIPLAVLAVACLMALLTSPPLRILGDYSSYWIDHAYSYDFTIRDVLFGYFANGYFPVFPWIIFPCMGFICGDLVFQSRRSHSANIRWLSMAAIGLLAISGLGLAVGHYLPELLAQHYANGLTEFPASTLFVVAMLGVALMSLLVLHHAFDGPAEQVTDGPIVSTLQRFSMYSLTLYILHHMVILWPMWIYGAWMGHADPTFYWRHAMSTPLAFTLALVFLGACHFVLNFLDSHKNFSLEALMRRLCD